MASVTVNLYTQPEGEEIEVPGLGVFPNGSTTEVTDEQVQTWEAINHANWEDIVIVTEEAPPAPSVDPVEQEDAVAGGEVQTEGGEVSG